MFLCEGLDPSTWKLIQKMGRVGRDSKEKALFKSLYFNISFRFYSNSDGLRVRVEPRSLTWAELRGVDEAKPSRSRGVQPKSGSEAQL